MANDEQSNDQNAPQPVMINKWDQNAVKNALDDAVKKCLVDKYDYTERFRLVDGRLMISALAVGCAFFAVLWDWLHPFPASKSVMIICVVAYFALMTLLQLYAWCVEGATFYVAVDEDPTGKNPDRVWSLASSMQRYDEIYEVEFEVTEDGERAGTGSLQRSVAEWIDDQGVVLQDLINQDVLNLHDSLMPSKKKN